MPDEVAATVVLDALSLPHADVTTPTELVRSLLGDVAEGGDLLGRQRREQALACGRGGELGREGCEERGDQWAGIEHNQ